MNVISCPSDIQSILRSKLSVSTIGFVPTMGNLHDGHLSLIKQSTKENDLTVVSIFVNPTQFGPSEDFNQYPRTLETDFEKLKKYPVDYCFTPSVQDIYPNYPQQSTEVHVPDYSDQFCGKFRPRHFDGVCTIVMKLFQCVPAHNAYFGEKDFQQVFIIKKMVNDLFLPVQIQTCPVFRQHNGLALSSRNQYLSESDQDEASIIFNSLKFGQTLAQNSPSLSPNDLIQKVLIKLQSCSNLTTQYLEIVDEDTLQLSTTLSKKPRFVYAGFYKQVRLIDTLKI